ncbi:Reverse transcriptase domain-containing protein, partial [Aphis craccivora]
QVLRRESPRNEMYNIVVASPELWRPREPSPAADDSSASSGIAADDDDLLGAPPPELDAANEFVDEEAHILMPDDTTPLHAFRGQFAALRAEPCSEEVWSRFVALVDEMTAEAAVIVKLPVRSDGRSSGNRTAIDPGDAKAIQSLYRRNRRRAVRLILSGEGQSCEVAVPLVEEHFRRVWAPSTCDTDIFPQVDGRDPVPMGPFQCADVSKRLGKFENTAPGDDGLTYRHWKKLDPECTVLTEVVNMCLRYKRVPPAWKKAVTVLIYKKGAKEDLGNWRPISLSRTLYKLYVGCVANRLTAWLTTNRVLSQCQKGFLPADGAFEHVHTLNRVLEKARTHAADKCVAWLDVSNAFGAIPHPALEAAIQSSGAGADFLEAVRDIYDGASSSVSVAGGMTADIPVRSGIKQGCPLSGLLFIMAIDPVVALLQGESADHKVLAFADDLCLVANSTTELQVSIDAAHHGLSKLGLQLNAAKCASLHISGRRPVGVRDTRFLLQGSPLRPLAEGEAATFLGAQVGFNIVPPLSTLAEIIDIGLRIARSMLAPWQRIDALKTFFYPSTVHLQRLGVFPKTDWARVDSILRPEIKKTFYLPQEASGEYLYGSTKRGCCGIRVLAEDSDIAAVDSAFKLFTSPDQRVAEDAAEHAEEVTKRRISKEPSIHEVGAYLSGEDEGVFREARGTGVASVWSRARNASKRLNVKWSLDGAPSVTHEGTVMGRKQRRAVMRTIRDTLRLKRSDALIAKPDQGRAVECVAAHAASSHFLREGDFTRFADWRFVHRARLNLVPLNGSSSWRAGDRRCRRCGYNTESLSHVVDHCMRYTALYLARHNAIVTRIKKAASTKFEVLSENQALGDQGLRPDLVLKKGPNIYVVDVTVPFDNRMEAFKAAAAIKNEKYEQLRVDLAAQHRCDAVVVPFIVGALGSWDPANDGFMRVLCSRSYANLMRKLCVSETISITRDIYIEHLSGVRQ